MRGSEEIKLVIYTLQSQYYTPIFIWLIAHIL